ncbi:MAG: capsular polysaccharide synthesis protein [Paludibacteraceae bacterium]|nr:capsular polysaccharide synthesis protein [Paludibacteraceae bacterium]
MLIKRIGIIPALYKLSARLFTRDKDVTAICSRIGAQKYLERYVHELPTERSFCATTQYTPTIWVCWLQGEEAMPQLLKKCVASIRDHCHPIPVRFVTADNITELISIPTHIKDKYEKGIINHTFYSDYVRLAILARYGGLWIDATVLFTENLPKEIIESDLFCVGCQQQGGVSACNWFIGTKPGNPIIEDMKECLELYWEKENKLISYSIFHLFFTLIVNRNETNRTIWQKCPYFSGDAAYILQREMFAKYSETRFNRIKKLSPFHKLTYKNQEEDEKEENTFFKKILEM